MTKPKAKPRLPFGYLRHRPGRPSPWVAGYLDPTTGREVTKAFPDPEAAAVWLAEAHVALAKGTHLDPRGPRTPLGAYWGAWITEARLAPTSRQCYAVWGEKHILSAFGNRELGSLRRGEIQAWANRLPLAPRTAATVLRILQSVLTAAVLDDLIPKSPARGVQPPPAARRDLVIPTGEEVEALAGAMYPRYAIAVRLAAECGLRLGEVAGLRTTDLDMLRRRLQVRRQAQTLTGEGVRLDLPPKSDSGYRTIPMAPATVEAVAAHLAAHPSRDGLVVTTAAGMPLRRGTLNASWTKAKRRAGTDPALRFHDLRHTFASRLIEAGADALTVKSLMGHASITTTYDVYGWLFPDQLDRAAAAVEAALTRASSGA